MSNKDKESTKGYTFINPLDNPISLVGPITGAKYGIIDEVTKYLIDQKRPWLSTAQATRIGRVGGAIGAIPDAIEFGINVSQGNYYKAGENVASAGGGWGGAIAGAKFGAWLGSGLGFPA